MSEVGDEASCSGRSGRNTFLKSGSRSQRNHRPRSPDAVRATPDQARPRQIGGDKTRPRSRAWRLSFSGLSPPESSSTGHGNPPRKNRARSLSHTQFCSICEGASTKSVGTCAPAKRAYFARVVIVCEDMTEFVKQDFDLVMAATVTACQKWQAGNCKAMSLSAADIFHLAGVYRR